MSLYPQAAHLNNEGITYLQSENFTRSIELLGKSIKIMKQELSKPIGANYQQLQSLSPSCDFLSVELPLRKQTNQQDDFIFNQAFLLPENEVDAICSRGIHTISSVIIFNLALAHHYQYINEHRLSLHDRNQNQQCLERIEKLYITALRLLPKQSCSNNRTALIVKLACVNNLSIIGSDNCYKAAAEALESLSSFVSFGSLDNNKTNGEIFEETALQRLLMNVLLLKAPRVAPAA